MLVAGQPNFARYIAGDPKKDYEKLLSLLANQNWPIPAHLKDFLYTIYGSLELSYELELGRKRETLTWFDKWQRAIRVDPIARVLINSGKHGGRESPTRKLARKMLTPGAKEYSGIDSLDAFFNAWREVQKIRQKSVPEVLGPATAIRNRRMILASDLVTLALTHESRKVFDDVGLWPCLQYLLYVEAWWLYLEHIVSRNSLPVDEAHYDLNSTVGVALFEALSRSPIPAPGEPYYLARQSANPEQAQGASEDLFIKELPIWAALTTDRFFADLWIDCMHSIGRPFITRSGIDKVAAATGKDSVATLPLDRLSYALDANELRARWPQYPETHHLPLVCHDPWDEDGVKFRFYRHSRYAAQLQVFVAGLITELATTELGLPRRPLKLVPGKYNRTGSKVGNIEWDRSDDPTRQTVVLAEVVPLLVETNPDVFKKERLEDQDIKNLNSDRYRYILGCIERSTAGIGSGVPPLYLGAGSFPWGGRKPPHITHRDGLTYDVQMGSDMQFWPLVDRNVARHLNGAMTINWPLVLRVLAKGSWADSLVTSVYAYDLGERKVRRHQKTLKDINTEYSHAILRYEKMHEEYVDALRFPLPLSITARREVMRFAFRLYADNKKDEAKELNKLVILTQLGEKMAKRTISDPLFIRQSSTEVDTFVGQNRILAFRALVTDIIVEPTIRLVEKIVRQSMLANSDNLGEDSKGVKAILETKMSTSLDIEQTWRDIESRLEDLPLPHNSASVQRGLIGTIALLVSGVRGFVYGSPTIFIRAIRAITDSSIGDPMLAKILLRCVGRLSDNEYRLCEFGFLPHNHYHHHHIEYKLQDYPQMYNNQSEDWGWALHLNQLNHLKEVWLDLGLDLRKFQEYLDKEPISENVSHHVKEERKAVLTYVDNYIVEYRSRFLMENKSADQSKESALGYRRFAAARSSLYNLLRKANEAELIASKPHFMRGTELREISEQSREVVSVLKNAIDFRAMKEYLDKSKEAGLPIALDSLEVWEDASLGEIVNTLAGPNRFKQRLQDVISFNVPPTETEQGEGYDEYSAEHNESDSSSEFIDEELLMKEVYEELVLRRAGVKP
jgi:hypothetical protein